MKDNIFDGIDIDGKEDFISQVFGKEKPKTNAEELALLTESIKKNLDIVVGNK